MQSSDFGFHKEQTLKQWGMHNMFLHYKLTAGLNVKFGPRYRGNSILQSRNKMSTKTSTVNMTECSSYYQKVYPRVSLLAELKDKKGSFQTITIKNFSHRCPCPIKLSKLYWKCMWREFLKSVRHLLKEVDGFMKFQFHVQYLRISERRLDCIWKRCIYIRLDYSKAPLKERKHLHMFVCFTCSQRTVPLQSVWLSSQICQSCDPH